MNEKKAKDLRRQAHNMWVGMKTDIQKMFTVHQVYKQLKKDLKNANHR